jgi:hypothetical protein
MLIYRYLLSISKDPLSCFPQRWKRSLLTPSPVGEDWEGGKNYSGNLFYYSPFSILIKF